MCAAGGSNIERGLCSAGAIPTLLSLIRRCLEHPQQVSAKKPSRPPRGAAAQSPLLEPGVAALSNLAVESAAVKDDMREAGAIGTCVQLLQSDVRTTFLNFQTHLPDFRFLLTQSRSRAGCQLILWMMLLRCQFPQPQALRLAAGARSPVFLQ